MASLNSEQRLIQLVPSIKIKKETRMNTKVSVNSAILENLDSERFLRKFQMQNFTSSAALDSHTCGLEILKLKENVMKLHDLHSRLNFMMTELKNLIRK